MTKITSPLGEGALILEADVNYQILTLMRPGESGVVVNPGCSDQYVYDRPAESMRLVGKPVLELYVVLDEHFRGRISVEARLMLGQRRFKDLQSEELTRLALKWDVIWTEPDSWFFKEKV